MFLNNLVKEKRFEIFILVQSPPKHKIPTFLSLPTCRPLSDAGMERSQKLLS